MSLTSHTSAKTAAVWMAVTIGLAIVVAGCANGPSQEELASAITPIDAGAPVQLNRNSAASRPDGAPSVAMALQPSQGERAIELYRLNHGDKPARVRTAGADLNGDGRAEIVAMFEGADWCTETGCTLVVFTDTGRGYRDVSTTVRAKAPVMVGAASTNGWRDLVVGTGGARFGEVAVRLRFSGSSYPGNAITQAPESRGSIVAEEVIPAAATQALASLPPGQTAAATTPASPAVAQQPLAASPAAKRTISFGNRQ